ncbi:MAG: hypothetical protein KC416_16260, partial [Myxococcales bacterium]|nr:hypothetical protein [Myxococcales bacterium]
LALEDPLLVIGAPLDDGLGTESDNTPNNNSGALYVYERSAASWEKKAYLKPQDADVLMGGFFGSAADIEQGVVAVGAARVLREGEQAGAVFVVRKSEGNWVIDKRFDNPVPTFISRMGEGDLRLQGQEVLSANAIDSYAGRVRTFYFTDPK